MRGREGLLSGVPPDGKFDGWKSHGALAAVHPFSLLRLPSVRQRKLVLQRLRLCK